MRDDEQVWLLQQLLDQLRTTNKLLEQLVRQTDKGNPFGA